jgi:hypothetical protein
MDAGGLYTGCMKLRYRYLICVAVLASLLVVIIGAGKTSEPRGEVGRFMPVINALNPDVVGMGAADFTLAVSGAHFAPNALIRWNGVARPTSVADSTAARTQVQAVEVAESGTVEISLVNPASANGPALASNVLVLRIASATSF